MREGAHGLWKCLSSAPPPFLSLRHCPLYAPIFSSPQSCTPPPLQSPVPHRPPHTLPPPLPLPSPQATNPYPVVSVLLPPWPSLRWGAGSTSLSVRFIYLPSHPAGGSLPTYFPRVDGNEISACLRISLSLCGVFLFSHKRKKIPTHLLLPVVTSL